MTIAPAVLQSIERLRADVEQALARWVAPPGAPPLLAEALRYPVEAGGKRLRPVLCLASAEAVAPLAGITEPRARARALHAACAVELIHTYSLVHDDLPAMDDDTLRRGRKTAHVVYGEGMAVLVGDGLLTRAFELIAMQPDPARELPWRKLQAISVLARAAGAEGMVGGQAIDLEAAGKGRPGSPPASLDRNGVARMHAKKTGALIRAAATTGAIMAGAPTDAVGAIDRYAAEIGLAFQIVDDILDVEGTSADLGKSAGKDAAAGKPTYPSVFGLEESRHMAAHCVERALLALHEAHVEGILPDLAHWVLARRS
ncbi:MAG TPA: farnesyl diphosphate synthase [Vicinamibacterales bacterium]|nr:farnesyl diphosphate synthase [Vicinamibacterales bacterium]